MLGGCPTCEAFHSVWEVGGLIMGQGILRERRL